MEFMQLNYCPGSGIPSTDSFCFGKKTDRFSRNSNKFVYRVRDHEFSNQNNGGWVIDNSNKTTFKLQLIF